MATGMLLAALQAKYAHADGCALKFSAVAMDALPRAQAEVQVVLGLPKSGPCADIRSVCLPGPQGGCQVALADKAYAVCPTYEALYTRP